MRKREGKYHQGKFNPRNPEKYKGQDIKNIVYRSSWELKFMKWCDREENILEWGSEEFFIPYFDPTTKKVRRYFPDFYMKVKDKEGNIQRYVIEVKPKRQVLKPEKTPRKKEKTFLSEVLTWEKNQAKWKAAKDFCEDRMIKFSIITEDQLGV